MAATTAAPVDADGDAVHVKWQWSRNGSAVAGQTAAEYTGPRAKGDRFRCTATPNDAEADGTPVLSGEIVVVDSPPVLQLASILPQMYVRGSTVPVDAIGGLDADGDPVTFRYRWFVNGIVADGQTGRVFTASALRGSQLWAEVTPFDGDMVGTPVLSNRVVIENSPPALAGLSIPAGAYSVASSLTAQLGAASDPDGDPVTVAYQWYVNNLPVAGATSGALPAFSFRHGDSVRVGAVPHDGTSNGPAVLSAPVVIGNTAPVFTGAAIAAGTYRKTDAIAVVPGAASDADFDGITLRYQWYVNGVPVAGQVSSTLANALVSKGDTVSAQVTPNDGQADGAPVFTSTVTIQNSAPALASASIAAGAYGVSSAVSVAAGATSDVDGDAVAVAIQWYRNGVLVAGQTGATYAGARAKGDTLYAVLTPTDGAANGAAVTSNGVTLGNSPPVLASAAIPARPYAQGETVPAVTGSVTDADGDPVTLRYEWVVNGVARVASAEASISMPAVRHGDAVYCRVVPTDGAADGAAVPTNTVTIQNALPSLASVDLGAAPIYATSTLTALLGPSFDLDGDPVALAFRWFRNGLPIPSAATNSLAGAFARGDVIRVEVTPNDGLQSGATVVSPNVAISNSPPTAPAPDLGAGPFTVSDTLTAVVGTAADADGDPLTVTNEWYRNGALVGGAAGLTLSGTSFARGDALQFKRVLDDGAARVTEASNVVTIVNALPVLAGVGIQGGHFAASVLTAAPAGAFDADGDAVSVRYRWRKNGAAIPGATASTLAGVFVPGDSISVTATPNDGLGDGPAVTSANVVISTNLLTSIAPVRGAAGTTLTLTGSGFGASQGANGVTVGGQAAAVVDWSDTVIHAVVPGLPSGNHAVCVVLAGAATNALTFGLEVSVVAMTPGTGSGGDEIVLAGSGFGAAQNGGVEVGGVNALVTSWSDTEVRFEVPGDAPAGDQAVVLSVGGQASSPQAFTVVPRLVSLSATSVAAGETLTLYGTNWGATQGAGRVTVGNAVAAVEAWTATQVSITVPQAAGAGARGVAVHLAAGITTVTISSADVPKAVPDGGSASAALDAAGVPGSLLDVAAGVNLSHPWAGDLSVVLRGPDGTSAVLVNPSADFLRNVVTVFPDLSYPVDDLTRFVARSAAGLWALDVTDHKLGDAGVIDAWRLRLTVSTAPTNALFVNVLPCVEALDRSEGSGGETIVVTGSNFGAAQGTATLELGGTPVTVQRWTSTRLEFAVPATAPAGSRAVAVRVGGILSNARGFRVVPRLDRLSAASGTGGDTITISGVNLGDAQGDSGLVPFGKGGGTVTSWSPTRIVVAVPAVLEGGAYDVKVDVGGIVSNALPFAVKPHAIALNVVNGSGGDLITVTGTNFGLTQAAGQVTLGGYAMDVVSWSSTSITATFSAALEPGAAELVVSKNGQAGNAKTFTIESRLTGLSTANGPVGHILTLNGTNLGSNAQGRVVLVGNLVASVAAWGPYAVAVTVPAVGLGPAQVRLYEVTTRAYSLVQQQAIPDQTYVSGYPTPGQLNTSINVSDNDLILSGKVSLAVNHPHVGDLTIKLGTKVLAQPAVPQATAPDYRLTASLPEWVGQYSRGTWTLNIADSAFSNAGVLNAWDLSFTVPGAAASNALTYTVYPEILALTPARGAVGATVSATGTNLRGTVIGITVGGTAATLLGTTGGVQFRVPTVTRGAKPVVITVDGYASNATAFTVSPSLEQLTPPQGPPGSVLTLAGRTFGTVATDGTVTVGGVNAAVLSWSDTSIQVEVPTLLAFGDANVVVTVGGVASNAMAYRVRPWTRSILPVSGVVGDTVTLQGVFGDSGSVTMAGVSCTVLSWAPDTIRITVPPGTGPGGSNIVVTSAGYAGAATVFTVKPRILGSSGTGVAGSTLTVTGENFGTQTGRVMLGGVRATIQSWSMTQVTLTVPPSIAGGSQPLELIAVGTSTHQDVYSATIDCASTCNRPISVDKEGFLSSIKVDWSAQVYGSHDVSISLATAAGSGVYLGYVWSSYTKYEQITTTRSVALEDPVGTWLLYTNTFGTSYGFYSTWNLTLTVNDAVHAAPATVAVTPAITALAPASVPAGSQVTLSGTSFGSAQGASYVTVGGRPATVVSWSMTSIAIQVPGDLPVGTHDVVAVVNGQPSAPSPLGIAYGISGMQPGQGGRGEWFTLLGSGFGAAQGASVVIVGAVAANVRDWSDNAISVEVPLASSLGLQSVYVFVNGVQSNTQQFRVIPGLLGVGPATVTGGDAVAITGRDFGATQGGATVTIGGVNVAVTQWYDGVITATVADSVPPGVQNVVVTIGGNSTRPVTCTVTPHIASLAPQVGNRNTVFSILGSNFRTAVSAETQVLLDGVNASPTIATWNSNALAVTFGTLPSAGTHSLQVLANGAYSNAVTLTLVPTLGAPAPAAGPEGTVVTLPAYNFGNEAAPTTVFIGGVPQVVATFTPGRSIVFTVPAGLEPGPYAVRLEANGVTSGTVPFTVNPFIAAQSVTTAVTGDVLTLTGLSMGSTPIGNTVSIGGIEAPIQSWSAHAVSVTVPAAIRDSYRYDVYLRSGRPLYSYEAAGLPVVVPMMGGVDSSLLVSDTAELIDSVEIYWNIDLPDSDNIQRIRVVHPDGTPVTLSSFDPGLISGDLVLPELAGKPAAGTWTLEIVNGGSSVPGTLLSWGLRVRTKPVWKSNVVALTVLPAITSSSQSFAAGVDSLTLAGRQFGVGQGLGRIVVAGIDAAITGWSPAEVTATIPASVTAGVQTVLLRGGGEEIVSTSGGAIGLTGYAVQYYNYSYLHVAGARGVVNDGTVTLYGAASAKQFTGAEVHLLSPRHSEPYTSPGISWSADPQPLPASRTGFNPNGTWPLTITEYCSCSGVVFSGWTLDLNTLVDTWYAAPLQITVRPHVTTLGPVYGVGGDGLTISGLHFGQAQNGSTVTVGGAAAEVVSWSADSLQVTVLLDAGAGDQAVQVTVNGVASDPLLYTVSPFVTSLAPASGSEGSTFTLYGNNFGTLEGSVTLGGLPATVTSWSTRQITVAVPWGVGTGGKAVTVTAGGQVSNTRVFTVTP